MVQSGGAKRSGRGIAAASAAALLGIAIPAAAFLFTPTVRGASTETTVHLLADGVEREWKSSRLTVADALAEAQVTLDPNDEISPPLSSPLLEGMTLQVVRVDSREVTKEEKVPYQTVFKRVSQRFRKLPTIVVPGKPGLVRRTYEVITRNGREVGRRPLDTQIVRAPVDQIVSLRGDQGLPSRGYFAGSRVLRMVATAYDPSPASCGRGATGRTAIGLRAGRGVVAVDPRIIPLGARLYIEGYGHAIAGDTGGAIKGHRIDLGYDSRRAALRFGRRPVTVHVLD
jgi:3D (Asp-Asp-Asp) domain-containing protein